MPQRRDLARACSLELGAATLGESGGAARCGPGSRRRGRARRSRRRRTRSAARPATTSRSTSRSPRRPSGSVLVVDVGDERELGYWGEVLTTGAEARGHRRARDRRLRARRRRARGARVPGVLHRDRARRARRRSCRVTVDGAVGGRRRRGGPRRLGGRRRATASSSCPATRSTPCSRAGRGPGRQGGAVLRAAAVGLRPRSISSLSTRRRSTVPDSGAAAGRARGAVRARGASWSPRSAVPSAAGARDRRRRHAGRGRTGRATPPTRPSAPRSATTTTPRSSCSSSPRSRSRSSRRRSAKTRLDDPARARRRSSRSCSTRWRHGAEAACVPRSASRRQSSRRGTTDPPRRRV